MTTVIAADLPQSWYPLRYHEDQARLWQSQKKFCAVVAGRGSGKTELARRRIVACLPVRKPWPDPIYIFALPTFAQAKRVAWKPLLNLIPKGWIKPGGPHVSDMTIETVFGSTLYVMGMDKPHRIEGVQIDGGVIDESSDQKPGTFTTSILPTLNHRQAWLWRIGVPKRSGVGKVEFRDFYEKGVLGDPLIDSFMWKSSTVLSPEELERQKSIMDPQDFEEQYNAVWLDAGGSVYHAYSEENLSEDCQYDRTRTVHVGADFNVDPMCWTLAHFNGEKLEVFDEIFLKNTNTENTLRHLENKFRDHEAEWCFYCDASSKARHTSSATGRTDYLIIKNYEGLRNKRVYYPTKNPGLKDRFATVNAALCNAQGQRKLFIHPRCVKLIKDFRMMAYEEGTTKLEDYSGTEIGHTSDACGYMVWKLLPMKYNRGDGGIVTR